jgi:NAD(P)-dependent dehydrogenase (short-subunit alcohol dehydrogenase family)
MKRVQGKVALVTGGGSGLGEASALMLAREGAQVVLADLNEAAAKRVLRQVKAEGGEGMAVQMARIERRYRALHVAVNCAGINRGHQDPCETTLADWQAVMAVNLDGVFLGTKHCLRLMTASAPVNGSIINVSSIMGLVGHPSIAAYNASKGGVRLYTKSVALSCAEKGLNVRVNSIHPGFIDTPLLRRSMERIGDPVQAQKTYDALQPVGRLGQPQDIAYGVLYLASDESRFMTGAELVIDGGYTAR